MDTQNQSSDLSTPPAKIRPAIVEAAIRLLTGWGVPGSIARIGVSALIGAISAAVALSQSRSPEAPAPEPHSSVFSDSPTHSDK